MELEAQIVLKAGDAEAVLGNMVALTSLSMGVPKALESILEYTSKPKDRHYSLILIETEAKEA